MIFYTIGSEIHKQLIEHRIEKRFGKLLRSKKLSKGAKKLILLKIENMRLEPARMKQRRKERQERYDKSRAKKNRYNYFKMFMRTCKPTRKYMESNTHSWTKVNGKWIPIISLTMYLFFFHDYVYIFQDIQPKHLIRFLKEYSTHQDWVADIPREYNKRKYNHVMDELKYHPVYVGRMLNEYGEDVFGMLGY